MWKSSKLTTERLAGYPSPISLQTILKLIWNISLGAINWIVNIEGLFRKTRCAIFRRIKRPFPKLGREQGVTGIFFPPSSIGGVFFSYTLIDFYRIILSENHVKEGQLTI